MRLHEWGTRHPVAVYCSGFESVLNYVWEVNCVALLYCWDLFEETFLGGLILDNILVFLYRTILRIVWEGRSNTWPTTVGVVEAAQASEHEMYPYAEVIYSYSVDNESYSGSYIRGCWFDNTAERFAKRFMPPKRVIIRYRPDNPAESFIKEKEFNLGPSS